MKAIIPEYKKSPTDFYSMSRKLWPFLNTCIDLKELRFPQDTIFSYESQSQPSFIGLNPYSVLEKNERKEKVIAAPLLQEVLTEIGKFGEFPTLTLVDGKFKIYIEMHPTLGASKNTFSDYPAEDAALLWIELQKEHMQCKG